MGIYVKAKEKIQNGVRNHISPHLTNLSAKLGFVNRQNLAQTLVNSELSTETLAKLGIVKWRFRKVGIHKIQPWMLSTRITPKQIEQLPEDLQKNLSQVNGSGFIPKVFGVDQPGAKIAFVLGFVSTLTLPSIITGSLIPAVVTLPAYLLISKGLIFYDKLNPNFTPYKVFKIGNDLLPWSLGIGLVAVGICIYLNSKEPPAPDQPIGVYKSVQVLEQTAKESAQAKIKKLEEKVHGLNFRDLKLKDTLELANLYYAVKDYDRAIEYSQKIINRQETLTARVPMYYHEATFLQADVLRAIAMQQWNPQYLKQSFELLFKGQTKLAELEPGYWARYNYELLKSCVIGELFFPEQSFTQCQSQDLNNYYQNTLTYNLYTPLHSDNFLAARTFLEMAKHYISAKNFTSARQELDKAFLLFALIDDCSNAYNYPRELVRPYLYSQDRQVGELVGRDADIFSYVLRCEATRRIRGDIWPFNSDQFNPNLFKPLHARAYSLLADIDLWSSNQDKEEHENYLLSAKNNLERALNIVLSIQQKDPFKFFTTMFEERETYYEVLIKYAETLLHLYELDPQKYSYLLDKVETYAKEVEETRKTEPLDIVYLKSLYLLGRTNSYHGNNQLATEKYKRILEIVAMAKTKGPLPPFLKGLEGLANLQLNKAGGT